jgi:hypothetical protein
MEATPQIRELTQAVATAHKVEPEFTVTGPHQLLMVVRAPVERETMRKIIEEVGVCWSEYTSNSRPHGTSPPYLSIPPLPVAEVFLPLGMEVCGRSH